MGKISQEDIELAQKVQNTYGVPASVVLGQKIQETGWNESTVGQNNYFNIKGNGNGGYADYDSKEASFMAYGELLTKERYTQHTQNATNVEEFVQGIKAGGYAEDSNYVTNVMNVINDNNLTQYDGGSISGFSGSSGSFASGSTSSSLYDLEWWGDIIIVLLSILFVIMGVVFLGMSVTNNSMLEVVKNPTNLIKKAVK